MNDQDGSNQPDTDYTLPMTTTNAPARLLTTAEAAAILNIEPRALKDHWRKWGIRSTKVGPFLRFREEDIMDYINSQVSV